MRRGLVGIAWAVALCACPGVKSKLCGAPLQPCCSDVPECDQGAVCDSTQTCVACGGAGQACCAGSACGAQAVCSSGACVTCGGEGQPCCAQSGCNSGLSCAGLTCTAGCSSPCTLGQSRCSSTGGVEACSTGAACPQWQSLITTCPTNSACQASGASADCVELCPVACTVDAVQCTTGGLMRCVLPNGASCPTLASEPDDPSNPQCVTGAQDGTDIVWESPTPLDTPLVAIAGELDDSYWVLDDLGNIIHNDLGSWVYELRATPGKRALALASCGLGSYLYAVGEAGTVYRRSGGVWTEENAGTTSDLFSVACDSAFNAYAAGADGKLYIRSGSWHGYATGFVGQVNALGYAFSPQKAILVGNTGQIVGCDVSVVPPTCAPQTSNTSANLLAAWGDTYTGDFYAAGTGGTLLQNSGAGWSALDTKSATSTLRAINGYYDSANNRSVVFAVGDDGAFFSRPIFTLEQSVAPAEPLTAVLPIDSTHIFVTSAAGAIYFTDQPSPPPGVSFAVRGGKKPITATLSSVSGIGMGQLFAVGQQGARYRRENATWLDDRAGLAVTDNLNGVAALSRSEAYAVGDNGRLLVRRYGTWSDDAPGLTGEALQGVTFDADTVYAVGTNGAWLEKPRSGGAWARVTQTATAKNLWGIAVLTDGLGHTSEVVAVGDDCTVLSKKNGTFSVLPVSDCPAGTPLYAAAFASNGDLFAAGELAVVVHRTATGWTREFLDGTGIGTLERVTALVRQGSNMWALCTHGEAYLRAANWAQFAPDLTQDDFFGGWFDADTGLYFVGKRGLVWRKP